MAAQTDRNSSSLLAFLTHTTHLWSLHGIGQMHQEGTWEISYSVSPEKIVKVTQQMSFPTLLLRGLLFTDFAVLAEPRQLGS